MAAAAALAMGGFAYLVLGSAEAGLAAGLLMFGMAVQCIE
jgi:hypothetical protein